MNCHLKHGTKPADIKTRSESVLEICKNAFVTERCTKSSDYYIENHTFRVFFGDLNFRIHADFKHAKRMIIMQDYHELMKYDELLSKTQKSNSILKGYTEGPLTFDPTYKY
jgi:hypothetical protein